MEKFALLNLLNLLQGLAPSQGGGQTADAADEQPENFTFNSKPTLTSTPPPAAEQAQNDYPNVMASVIERHEMIANRVRNKK